MPNLYSNVISGFEEKGWSLTRIKLGKPECERTDFDFHNPG
jgi:hypothetical protein